MSEILTNEEIREKLLKLKYNCGPVTDTTREIYLKKLESLQSKLGDCIKDEAKLTDSELRSQLKSYGQSVGPITSTNRHIYMKRLQRLKNGENTNSHNIPNENGSEFYDESEPMEVD